MRTIAAVLAFALLASPAFAKGKSKAPRAGGKSAVGTTVQDAKGNSLECKADKKGKTRWTKKQEESDLSPFARTRLHREDPKSCMSATHLRHTLASA